MMNSKSSLKSNFIMNAILSLSSILFPLVTFPYVSRVLTPSGTGKVSFATSIVSYFVLLSQLGIPTYGIKVCASCRGNQEKISRVVQELVIISLVSSTVAFVFFYMLVQVVPELEQEKTLLMIIGTTILLNGIGMEWLYKGIEDYKYITISSLVFKGIAVVAMFLFVKCKNDYIIYGGLSVFAASASNILNLINGRNYIFHKTKIPLDFKRHFKAIFVFFAMACAATIYTHVDVTMLGFMKNDVDVGYYNAAIKMKQFLVGIITSLGAVLLPRSVSYIEEGKYNKFVEISKSAIDYVLFISIPLTIYFIVFGKESIFFLSGSEYFNSVIPMQIMMPTLIFISLSNIIGIQMLVPLGNEKQVLHSELIGTVVNVSLNTILIPQLASIGAAVGTLFAEFAVLVFQYHVISKKIKNILQCKTIIRYVFVSFCSIAIVSLLKLLEMDNFACLIISASIYFIFYVITLVFFKDRSAYNLINQILSRFRK